MCDNYYNPQAERGIAYNDPLLNVDWQIPNDKIIVSPKDLNNPLFTDSEKNF